jgi:hypothetical protein
MTGYQTKETTEGGVQHLSIFFRQTMERVLNKPSSFCGYPYMGRIWSTAGVNGTS